MSVKYQVCSLIPRFNEYRGTGSGGWRATMARMVIECPECRTHASQGTNYAMLLDLAEGGKLTCQCPLCDHYWRPSMAEQALIAANLRQMIQAKNG